MYLTRHLQILGSLVLAMSLFVYYLLLSISLTYFMSNLKRTLIIKLLRTNFSSPWEGFGAVIPQTKLPAPKLKYEIL